MNTLLAEAAHHASLTSDTELEDRVLALIGTAGHRQLWLMLLADDDRQLPVVIPFDDLPREPDHASADALVGHLAGILAQVGATQLVLVWERPGRGRLTDTDRAWADALAVNCARRGLRLRAQLLSHTRGVTLLAPADYAPDAGGPLDVSSDAGGSVDAASTNDALADATHDTGDMAGATHDTGGPVDSDPGTGGSANATQTDMRFQ